ncbi:MAG TPA: HEAT repeat domain-containing protein [Ktedonosporobacter sp.]|nr:HEAT repeat domain-containing protein [Ktedonosporobacter sp.]
MEPQNCQGPQSLEHTDEEVHGMEHWPSDALLASVLRRVEPLNDYLVTPRSAQSLIQDLQDPHWEVRAMALHALGKHAEDVPIDPFLVALRDQHTMVRAAAVQALGCLGERLPLDQLVIALQDRAWEVRERVVLVLGDLVTTELAQVVRPLLIVAQQDAHRIVCAAANAALETYATLSPQAAPPLVKQSAPAVVDPWQFFRHGLRHCWEVCTGQLHLVPRTWLIVTFLVLLTSYSLALFTSMHYAENMLARSIVLAAVTTFFTSVGLAFTINVRYDAGLELELTTPTSLRLIMFCRCLLVIGVNVLFSLLLSVVIALFYGQGLWGIVEIWLGPLLLVSSLTMALTLVIGAWLSLLAASLLEMVPFLWPSAMSEQLVFWQGKPLLLIAFALCCYVFTFIYLPTQARRCEGS